VVRKERFKGTEGQRHKEKRREAAGGSGLELKQRASNSAFCGDQSHEGAVFICPSYFCHV